MSRTCWLHWFIQRKQRKRNIRSGGYSQYGQDVTVFDLLGKPSQGVFLDIGANDGKSLSNSLLFEEKGWTGVCVDPHPIVFESLKKNRKGHLVNACIADKDGTVNFLAVEGPANMLSGIKEFCDVHHMERIGKEIAQNGGTTRTVEIEALSPATLCNRFDIRQIDFLSIDTEGCELQILKSFDFENVPVRIISVENGSRSSSIFRYLTSKGFVLIKCVGCDEIYRHKAVTL
ncbi:MAG: FkbM family methyltransferase [Kiritimatiellales bacterium]